MGVERFPRVAPASGRRRNPGLQLNIPVGEWVLNIAEVTACENTQVKFKIDIYDFFLRALRDLRGEQKYQKVVSFPFTHVSQKR